MPISSDRFAISLPVDPSDRYRLVFWILIAGALTASLLLGVASGTGKLVALGPMAGTVACVRRLLRAPPPPRHVDYRPALGWSLEFPAGRVGAELLPHSWFGRRFALAVFRTADGRHLLVPLRHLPGRAGADWRRLLVLCRTGAVTLVANSSNC